MSDGKESGCFDAGRCFTTTSGTASARINKGTSTCRGVHWPDWDATNGERGLLGIRENYFSWAIHEGKREEEVWIAEGAKLKNKTEEEDLEMSNVLSTNTERKVCKT